MPIDVLPGEHGGPRTIISGPVIGIDTKSAVNLGDEATGLAENRWASLQNMRLINGQPVRMDGSTLYATSFVMPDNVAPIAAYSYTNSDGTQIWVAVSAAGIAYTVAVAGGAATFTERRNTLSAAQVFMAGIQVGDYMVLTDRTNGHWKWDGTNFIPLGAKMVSTFEASETWTGGTANTTTYRQGIQSRNAAPVDGGTVNLERTITDTNFTTGLLLAKAYPTTGTVVARIHFFVNLTNQAQLDTALSFIRFGNAADTVYFQATASLWGTLAAGWNEVFINLTAFVSTGAPVWTDIDKILIRTVDTAGGAQVSAIYDDLYITYAATEVMPPCAVNSELKSVYFAGDTTTNGRSAFQFAKAGGPDQFDATAFNQIKEKDGTNVSGMFPFYNQLFLTKENSCHSISVSLTGTVYPAYNFDLQQVTTEHGCTSHRSLLESDKKIYMHWRGRFGGTMDRRRSTCPTTWSPRYST